MTNEEHKRRFGKSLGVNHLDGDTSNWDRGNLRVQCDPHHNRYDAARRRRARRALIIAVVGLPGTGKTAVTELLGRELRLSVLRIDDYRDRFPGRAWTYLVEDLRELAKHVIVESNVIPPGYDRLLRQRPSTRVLLRCDRAERRRRLEARGDAPELVEQYLKAADLRLRADLVVDTTEVASEQVARDLARRIRRRST